MRRGAYSPLICFAGHDFKFVDPYMSSLKKKGCLVIRDQWNWGASPDRGRSRHCFEQAEILFCEWGLANALWYSKWNARKKPLYVRVHLQEIAESAARFGRHIRHQNVTSFIFVSERVRREAIKMFGWPADKTVLIPNFVLTDEYSFGKREFNGTVKLGMVGTAPARKRLDRAVRLVELLLQNGVDARLFVKGHRPESMEFMKTRRRAKELEYYTRIYKQIGGDPQLKDRVVFDSWGNDVALWYENIHFILSCSDFESFHYSIADGISAGCHPVIWPWEDAETIYDPEWVVRDTAHAAARVMQLLELPDDVRHGIALGHREVRVRRYGYQKIFSRLNAVLGIGPA